MDPSNKQLRSSLIKPKKKAREDFYPNGRKLRLSIIVPRNLKSNSSTDLKIMLISLKNAISVCSGYSSAIEKELKKRGSVTTILHRDEIRRDILDVTNG